MRNYVTDIDVLQDLYLKLVQGGIGNVITGDMYLKKRPFNSETEDCVVSFLSGRDGQTQTGIVTVNIFVPNVAVSDNGGYQAEDFVRTELITRLLNQVIHDPTIMAKGRYLWKPNTIVSVFELEQADEHAHFVHVEIQFTNNTCN